MTIFICMGFGFEFSFFVLETSKYKTGTESGLSINNKEPLHFKTGLKISISSVFGLFVEIVFFYRIISVAF